MKVIVAGGRDFYNYTTLSAVLTAVIQLEPLPNIPELALVGDTIEIVSGGARGADRLGERFAKETPFTTLKVMKAEWKKFGKGAGFLRNEQMALYADTLVAFWDHKSKGTQNMIETAMKYNLRVIVIPY